MVKQNLQPHQLVLKVMFQQKFWIQQAFKKKRTGGLGLSEVLEVVRV
jgi:hypothetical protein